MGGKSLSLSLSLSKDRECSICASLDFHLTSNTYHPTSGRRPSPPTPTLQSDEWGKFKFESKLK